MIIHKSGTHACQPINIRRFNFFVSVTTHDRFQIVHGYKKDIWTGSILAMKRWIQNNKGENE
jgi:hypothetical protein